MTTPKPSNRVVVVLAVSTLVAIGLVLVDLPTPVFLMIAAGLALLTLKHVWASRRLRAVRESPSGQRSLQPPRSGFLPSRRSVLTVDQRGCGTTRPASRQVPH